MRLSSRIKKLEQRTDKKAVWAVFSINYYEDVKQQKMAQERLVDAYLSEGNRTASCYIFINEIPGPADACCEERHLCSCAH